MKHSIVSQISNNLLAIANCKATNNEEWRHKHQQTNEKLVKYYMPSGAGWDSGTTFEEDESNPHKLVFSGSYHHMNDLGTYDGWTDHKIIVTPRFNGIDIRITGRNRNGIKEYLHQLFYAALQQEVEVL